MYQLSRIRNFLLSSFFIGLAFTLTGQHHLCGTIHNETFMNRLDANVKRLKTMDPHQRNVPKYIPMTFVLVADDNGNGRVQEERVLEQLHNINSFYASHELIFYLDEFRYLDKTVAYNTPGSTAGEIQLGIVKDNNAISVNVCNSADSGSGQPGLTLGYYDPGRDWLVMRKGQINATSTTLAHETGHFFSLAHPHLGWECVAYNEDDYGNPVILNSTLSVDGCFQPTAIIELVDGSNCSTAADRVCDTPADYNFAFSPDYRITNCNSNSGVLDNNGTPVLPMVTNLMGYYDNCGNYELTNGQVNLVNSDYFSFDRAFIRTGIVPNLDIVEGPVDYVYPENNGETATFDNVTLDWDDVPGATKYLLVIARNSSFSIQPTRHIIDTSELNLTNLEEGKKYFWRVWPFNETSTNAGWGTTMSFTATTATAVKTINGINRVEIYPNPVSSGNDLILNIESTDFVNVRIQLLDLHGRIIQSFGQYNFTNGVQQSETLHLDQFSNGLYLIQMTADDGGVVTRKIQILK